MLQYHTGSTPQRSRIRCDRLKDRQCGDFDQSAHSSRHKWVSSGSECPGSNCRSAILDTFFRDTNLPLFSTVIRAIYRMSWTRWP
ncbi:hypothetical protein I7I50_00109 [Histoplasma capsulatum G186AR]|uniref:Uncharacterized protein n=1 Tax=Ajellomyces capsulatus TaxID=5037 RepID=A0A8H7YI57_AJECA|nr:hypothetical protein I7I52_07378 [Histoplasma capsulatum]QSS72305.1 hypothetical protein I7I50_00109 [Histoplasma capsulatum G186AR]